MSYDVMVCDTLSVLMTQNIKNFKALWMKLILQWTCFRTQKGQAQVRLSCLFAISSETAGSLVSLHQTCPEYNLSLLNFKVHPNDAVSIVSSLETFHNLTFDPNLIYCPARYVARLSRQRTLSRSMSRKLFKQMIFCASDGNYQSMDGVGTLSKEFES